MILRITVVYVTEDDDTLVNDDNLNASEVEPEHDDSSNESKIERGRTFRRRTE